MRMFSKEIKRWLRALGIAKILFENQGQHSGYLKEIENFVRRETMYSQKALNGSGVIELKKDSSNGKKLNLQNEI